MRKVNGETKDLWKKDKAVGILKANLDPLQDGEILQIMESEWEWLTEPHSLVYQMVWRGWIPYTVSCRKGQDCWYLKKVTNLKKKKKHAGTTNKHQ